MSPSKKATPQGSDWTRLLTDPDLVSHLAVLLQTYRDVPVEQREQALLNAMREIKESAIRSRASGKLKVERGPAEELPCPQPVTEAPPFEPDLFAAPMASDRRRFNRIKCNVAVEIRVESDPEPVWGNLANVSRGGCLVKTVRAVPPNKALEIGLWLASGTIWVKGVVISGMVTRITSSYEVRVQFSRSELSEKEHLREFLKFVENEARKTRSENNYLAQLKS